MATRASLCSVERGLYSFRYRSIPPGPAPLAVLRVVSGPVTFVTAPGRTSAQLSRQGQVIVLVADGSGVIEVDLQGGDPFGADETSFALDLLDRGGDAGTPGAGPAAPAGRADPPAEPDGVLLGIDAHVSRLGDVRVAPGSWVAGPDLPLPIEGLALREGRRSPGLEVQVRSAGSGAWSPWARSGQFAGSRQRAECLTGIRVRLNEAHPPAHMIAAEALFLGSSAVRREGTFVELAGPDPLVGLKLDVAAAAHAARDAARDGARDAALDPARTGGGVRVFKARR